MRKRLSRVDWRRRQCNKKISITLLPFDAGQISVAESQCTKGILVAHGTGSRTFGLSLCKVDEANKVTRRCITERGVRLGRKAVTR